MFPALNTPQQGKNGMAKAFIEDVECAVTVDQDLGDSWAVTVVPPRAAKGATQHAPLVVKLQGESPEKIVKGALEILQQRGAISRYELDPVDQAP